MLFGILLVLFIFVCIFLCLIVLIQSDKGGGISGAIGGLGGASNFLGTQDTANILTRGTAIFGGAFLLLCILMTFVASTGNSTAMEKSGLQKRAEKAQSETPAPLGPSMGIQEGQSSEGTEVLPSLAGEESTEPAPAPAEAAPAEPAQSPAE